MKKLLILVLLVSLCGCSLKEEEVITEPTYNFTFEGNAKEVCEKYKIMLDKLNLSFDIVEGYNDTLEFYMTDIINDDNRVDGYKKIIEYLSSISIDNKILEYSSDNLFDVDNIDYLSRGIFFRVNINNITYKVKLYQYNNKKINDKEYSTYQISFEE